VLKKELLTEDTIKNECEGNCILGDAIQKKGGGEFWLLKNRE